MKRFMGIFMGIVMIGMGIVTQTMVKSADACTFPAEGTVVGYYTTVDDEDSTAHYPIIQYQYDNKLYEEQAHVGSGSKPYAEGEKVSVLINPDNPNEFYIEGSMNIFNVVSWVVIGLGIVFIIAEIIKFLKYGFR